MIKFLTGFLTAAVLIFLALFCYVRFGFVDPRADVEPGSLEKKVAMPALDASVDRRVPDLKNPIQPTEENLISGMKIYQATCSAAMGISLTCICPSVTRSIRARPNLSKTRQT